MPSLGLWYQSPTWQKVVQVTFPSISLALIHCIYWFLSCFSPHHQEAEGVTKKKTPSICTQGRGGDAAQASSSPSTDLAPARAEQTGTNYLPAAPSYRLHLFPLRNQTGQLSVLIPPDNQNLSCLPLPPFSQSQLLLPLSHTYTDFLLPPSAELWLTSGVVGVFCAVVFFLIRFCLFF